MYYLDNDFYNGLSTDKIDCKLCMFKKRWDQAGADHGEKYWEISIMLTGRTKDYYFDHLRCKNLTFDNMMTSYRCQFITAEHDRRLVRVWNNLTVNILMAENAGKLRKFFL